MIQYLSIMASDRLGEAGGGRGWFGTAWLGEVFMLVKDFIKLLEQCPQESVVVLEDRDGDQVSDIAVTLKGPAEYIKSDGPVVLIHIDFSW